jgi:hypothetical protein
MDRDLSRADIMNEDGYCPLEYDVIWDEMHSVQIIYNDIDMVYSSMYRLLNPDEAYRHICYMQESLDDALYTRIKSLKEALVTDYPDEAHYNLTMPSMFKKAQAWWDVMEQNKVAAKSTVEA